MTVKSKIKKSAAVASGLMAATFVSQQCDAGLVTVGGDGGVGSAQLTSLSSGGVDVGGLLSRPVNFYNDTSQYFFRIGNYSHGNNRIGNFVRASIPTSGNLGGDNKVLYFLAGGGAPQNGALLNSTDNWLPGLFNVNGVNNGGLIYGWLHVDIRSGRFNDRANIISFTYDDMATDTTAFVKPVGGFSVSAVPEPSTFTGFALLALGAAGVRRRRNRLPKDGNN
jgi:MYXO-CTERM domain-containing protein